MNSTSNIFKITHGEDKVMALVFRYTGTSNPVDLSTAAEIIVKLPLLALGYQSYKLSLSQLTIDPSSPKLGRILVPISAANSILLKDGLGQDMEVELTLAAGVTSVRFVAALNVLKMIDEVS